MRDGYIRCSTVEFAQRVNAAVKLVDSGVPVAAAAGVLAERFGCSPRQARRYVERAASAGRVVVPEEMVAFTVKLPAALAVRVRERAARSGGTVSALVAVALTDFLARPGTQPRRR